MSFDAHLLSLRTLFDPERAAGFETALELRLDGEPFRAVVSGGALSIERGEVAEPDAVVTSDPGTILAVARGPYGSSSEMLAHTRETISTAKAAT